MGVTDDRDDPETEAPKVGRFWTLAQLAVIDGGCGAVTTMGLAIAETYARRVRCSMHRPVGPDGEFVWDGTDERVGT